MPSSELGASIGRFGLIAAGGYAFGPVGAAAGAVLGSFLFASSGPKIEGPRLGDLEVSSSAYGGVIPIGFGVQKVAGAMIWATDIVEVKNTRTVGGALFGGGQKIVEYRYFANFAVAFGEGPAGGVLRIWAGDRLIADLRTGASAYANHPKYNFRVHLGTEDQEPDRLIRNHIEGKHGDNAAPPFRGLVTIVFEDLPLDEFGNRTDHRRDHLVGRAAGGGQEYDVPVGGQLLHQQCGPGSGARVSLLQDVPGRDRGHPHRRHGRGPAGGSYSKIGQSPNQSFNPSGESEP